MKTNVSFFAAAALLAQTFYSLGQGTAFTYQGRLGEAGAPANGSYALRFHLFDMDVGASLPLGGVTNENVTVSNALFTVTLDFGAAAFDGDARWLEIGVRTNGGADSFATLTPRQKLTATPYAITARNVSGVLTSGSLIGNYSNPLVLNNTANQFTGTFIGNGGGLTNINGLTLGGLASSSFWQLGGNMGAISGTHFLGTVDNRPLDMRVNNLRALRLEPTPFGASVGGAPNVIGGSGSNSVVANVHGATIAGGGAEELGGVPHPNRVNGNFGTVSGGRDNTSSEPGGTVGGGINNVSAGVVATVSGGIDNSSIGHWATVGGGETNRSIGGYATISGGHMNTVIGNYATIGGGQRNSSTGDWATVSGGRLNISSGPHATVGGGDFNTSSGFHATVGGGGGNLSSGDAATVAGGSGNTGTTNFTTVGGGYVNISSGEYASVLGGSVNRATGVAAVIGGGWGNISSNSFATIPGGQSNVAGGRYSFAAGQRAGALHPGAFVWADSQDAEFASTVSNQFSVRAGGGVVFRTSGQGIHLDGQPVLSGLVGTLQLADGAVTADKMANLSVNNSKLTLNSVSTPQLVNDSVTSAKIFNGTVLAEDVNAGSFVTTFWKADGNTGTTAGTHFVGTTDNQAVELKVNGQRALRLEPHVTSPRLIGGFNGNSAAPGAHGVVIGGGGFAGNVNRADALLTVIAGGSANTNAADGAFIGGGFQNTVHTQAYNATIVGGVYHNVHSNAAYSAIGGGWDNNVNNDSPYSAITGGIFNDIGTNSGSSTISGGNNNNISTASAHATISGGLVNNVGTNSPGATIGGGRNNAIADDSPYATIVGGSFGRIGDEAQFSFIGGGEDHTIAGFCAYSVIAGGNFNSIGTNSGYSFIGGGEANRIAINSYSSVIGGGLQNNVGTNSEFSVIAGGEANDIGNDGIYNTIGGGYNNNIVYGPVASTIAGGYQNNIGTNADYGTIGGGLGNAIALNSDYATIPGGVSNFATNRAFAAGTRAKANHSGAFVWADGSSTAVDVTSTNNNSITMRAAGGYRLFSNSGATIGAYLAPGSGSWTSMSDRNAKENFEPVNARAVLDKVVALPLSTWNYKAQTNGVRHIGPMAQDFKASFRVGETDTGITTVDADGVALAAIQGLNQKLEAELAEKTAEIAELKRAVAEFRDLLLRGK